MFWISLKSISYNDKTQQPRQNTSSKPNQIDGQINQNSQTENIFGFTSLHDKNNNKQNPQTSDSQTKVVNQMQTKG